MEPYPNDPAVVEYEMVRVVGWWAVFRYLGFHAFHCLREERFPGL